MLGKIIFGALAGLVFWACVYNGLYLPAAIIFGFACFGLSSRKGL